MAQPRSVTDDLGNEAMTIPVEGLDALEQRVCFDLACLNYPPPNWVVPTTYPGCTQVTDVVVIGAGMAGLVLTFSLLRNGIRNIRCLDRNPDGFEGPWATYARMETLRSPKVLTGPAAGIPSLTFRAWFVAQFGHAAWQELDKIPRLMWMDYLRWYRRILALPIENNVEVQSIRPVDNLLALDLADGTTILAGKTVMATGREGLGQPRIPDFIRPIPRHFWAHTADDIDFAALRNKRVIVIGGSASAMDNAAEALEHGCAELRLLIRRNDLPRINKLTGIGSAGFTHGYRETTEAWQWRTMLYSEETGPPAPHNSTLRVSRHPNAHFHLGSAIETIVADADHITVRTSRGKNFAAHFIILATGFTVDAASRPEIAAFADAIATWSDRYTPPPELANAELGAFPYLGPHLQFTEKRAGEAPFLANIHCFNHAASLSIGKVAGDIPGISTGAAWLADGIAAEFYNRDIEAHWQILQDFDKPELFGDEWTDAER
jgi:cation diffusion facilitator CzcD-associated flavoprotein CzcO